MNDKWEEERFNAHRSAVVVSKRQSRNPGNLAKKNLKNKIVYREPDLMKIICSCFYNSFYCYRRKKNLDYFYSWFAF